MLKQHFGTGWTLRHFNTQLTILGHLNDAYRKKVQERYNVMTTLELLQTTLSLFSLLDMYPKSVTYLEMYPSNVHICLHILQIVWIVKS